MPESPRGWRLTAPAKLNLSLHIVGRRADGFHELDSHLVLLALADGVSFDPAREGLSVTGDLGPELPEADDDNLAWRGWQAGWDERPRPGGLILDKAIPIAAGLGGGSSDAAAAWRLARHIVDGEDPEPTAAHVAQLAGIGADVPFFAARLPSARARGFGERVEPAVPPGDAREVTLAHPPFGLSTAAVFAELGPADWSAPDGDPGPGRNDLLAPARRLRPEIDAVFRLVSAAGGDPHLTGSGPTVFVLTDDPERADGVATRVERAGLAATRTHLRSEPASIEPG